MPRARPKATRRTHPPITRRMLVRKARTRFTYTTISIFHSLTPFTLSAPRYPLSYPLSLFPLLFLLRCYYYAIQDIFYPSHLLGFQAQNPLRPFVPMSLCPCSPFPFLSPSPFSSPLVSPHLSLSAATTITFRTYYTHHIVWVSKPKTPLSLQCNVRQPYFAIISFIVCCHLPTPDFSPPIASFPPCCLIIPS
jgi:hypothetical protein